MKEIKMITWKWRKLYTKLLFKKRGRPKNMHRFASILRRKWYKNKLFFSVARSCRTAIVIDISIYEIIEISIDTSKVSTGKCFLEPGVIGDIVTS